ncbi:elongation factor P maturation arginine rhamnosyltransferase EarP [Thauera sinica]|uniref:Protein-arginine rhamnosyltransferase n=1 Tax=Thauera sinica TaxID=2665146 RepID=A0ABW1ANY2_9RHOO
MPFPARWEIFCQVVDNFGDIGVCWRLARDLAQNHGCRVRLWVDDWPSFVRLCPAASGADPERGFEHRGVEVRRWAEPFAEVEPADVVIEAFACEIPETHLQAMAARAVRPVWINLEYLSAEAWVGGCHAMASPHPRLPLVKHFFFPGFDDRTGGLLREPGLLAERDAFRREPGGRARWLAGHGLSALPADALLLSLFAYEQPDLPSLMQAWRSGGRPVVALVPEGRVLADVARGLGRDGLAAGDRVRDGRLEVVVLPFTDQPGYDRLLWSCDLNFVRGEDSFVRAQWAGRPFVWQIYPQHEQGGVHRDKLDAFLARYEAGLPDEAALALRAFWLAWNEERGLAGTWHAFAAVLPALEAHAAAWCGGLAGQADLSTRLTEFCFDILPPAG